MTWKRRRPRISLLQSSSNAYWPASGMRRPCIANSRSTTASGFGASTAPFPLNSTWLSVSRISRISSSARPAISVTDARIAI